MTRFAAVVLVDAEGRLLMQERDEHAPIDPAKWGFCGGHLEEGEDFAARCELTDADVECREGRRIVFVDAERARDLDLTAAARVALPAFLASERYAEWAAGQGGNHAARL